METKTEAFRRNVIKRLYRQSLPQWIAKLKGHGFYVIHKKYNCSDPHVEKGVVGDVIVSDIQVMMDGPRLMTKGFEEQMLKYCRKELVVTVNLYKAPFDVIKHKYSYSHGISKTGYLGTYSLMDLYRTKADAMEGLRKGAGK